MGNQAEEYFDNAVKSLHARHERRSGSDEQDNAADASEAGRAVSDRKPGGQDSASTKKKSTGKKQSDRTARRRKPPARSDNDKGESPSTTSAANFPRSDAAEESDPHPVSKALSGELPEPPRWTSYSTEIQEHTANRWHVYCAVLQAKGMKSATKRMFTDLALQEFMENHPLDYDVS